MGARCSCLHTQVGQEEKLNTMTERLEVTPEAKRYERENSSKMPAANEINVIVDVEMDIGQVVLIQSLLRGYAERKKAKKRVIPKVRESREIRNRAAGSSRPVSLDNKSPIGGALNEISADHIPDYLSPAVKALQASLGPFNYKRKKPKSSTKRGPVLMENQSVYIGDWNRENQRHGRGVQFNPEGSIYEGYWNNDKRSGKGRQINSNGDYYEGEWKSDLYSGHGIFVQNNGYRYEGSWEYGNKHGYGEELLNNATQFQGNFDKGVKSGQGKLIVPDKGTYEGEFYGNCFEGNGSYTWTDGRVFQGSWRGDKMNGKGVFTWEDGRKYEGEYVDDKKHGFGVFVWPDGRKYEGEWKNDKQDGPGLYTTNIGTRKGIWKAGKRINE